MSDSIAIFKRAFGYEPDAAADGALGDEFRTACRTAGRNWQGTRDTIQRQLKSLRDELASTYKGMEFEGAVVSKFNTLVTPFLTLVDGRFSDVLNAVADADNAAVQAQQVEIARKAASRFQGLIGNATLADLDDNPFMPLGIRAALADMLASLPKQLQAG